MASTDQIPSSDSPVKQAAAQTLVALKALLDARLAPLLRRLDELEELATRPPSKEDVR